MVLALHACYDIAGNLFRGVTEAKYVANDIAKLAVVVLGAIEGTVNGNAVASLVAVTVILLLSVVLLVLLLLLILVQVLVLVLVVVTILVLLVAVALAVPIVLFFCAFEVCVLSMGMQVTRVACFSFRLVHMVWIATIVVVVVLVAVVAAMLVSRGIVVATVVPATIVSTILAWAVVVVVAAIVLPRSTVPGFVACLAAVIASLLALATVCLIDYHLVVGQSSGH